MLQWKDEEHMHWSNGHYNGKIESIYIGLMDVTMERLRVYTLV